MDLKPYETEADEHGIKTRVFYRTNSNNELVKVTQQIKVETYEIKVKKSVADRQERLKGKFFGNITKDNNTNVTIQDTQDVSITHPNDTKNEDGLPGNMEQSYKLFHEKQMKRRMEEKFTDTSLKTEVATYVPPSMRNKENKIEDGNKIKYNYFTLRVNNLSTQTTEQDIADLFGNFGNIKRVFLSKNKLTNMSKGFGFVSYYNTEDAKKALDRLNGYGYDNLILQVGYSIDRDP
jgi:hypothetical protein